MDSEVSSHTTFMGCVSATGEPSGALLIFQGERAFSKFTEQWPECPFAMDSKGYMTREIFFRWATAWEEETRPENSDEPRCLFLDNHYSHYAVDTMAYLRAHNVRVVALHPHTTHVLCALDCGIFRSFKQHFTTLYHAQPHVNTIKDVSGLVKHAWTLAMNKTANPITKVEDSVTIRAFKRVGLVPFNRNVVDDSEFGYTEQYKAENAGGVGKKVARIGLSDEELAKRKADILSDYKSLPEDVEAAVKRAPRTSFAEIYTYSETLIKEAAKSEVKDEEAKRKAEYPWTIAGITYKVYCKQQKEVKAKRAEAEKEAKKAKKLATEEAARAAFLAAAKAKLEAEKAKAQQAPVIPMVAPPPKPKAPPPAHVPMVVEPPPQRPESKRGVKRGRN
jgi:DDE superfamily endonuclease